jgi:hypothetical protein
LIILTILSTVLKLPSKQHFTNSEYLNYHCSHIFRDITNLTLFSHYFSENVRIKITFILTLFFGECENKCNFYCSGLVKCYLNGNLRIVMEKINKVMIFLFFFFSNSIFFITYHIHTKHHIFTSINFLSPKY